MREIKFRGQRIDNNEWIYGSYMKHLNRTPCPIGDEIEEEDYKHLIMFSGFSDWNMPKPIDCIEIKSFTAGQFTGLKDKNGVEIYEGDVIKYQKLVYHDYGAGVYDYKTDVVTLESLRYWLKNEKFGFEGEGLVDIDYHECKIIGNIYDNPELIETEV